MLITFETGKTGLTTVGYQILNDDRTEYAARTIVGVVEIGVSGIYSVIIDDEILDGRAVVWDTGEEVPRFGTSQGIIIPDVEPAVVNWASILNSVKKMLGIGVEETQFDQELIIFINSAFSTLLQLGVGPTTAFSITDNTAEWATFMGARTDIDNVKTYIYLKVRLVFDPPQTGYLVDAIKSQIAENEWRLNDWTYPEEV